MLAVLIIILAILTLSFSTSALAVPIVFSSSGPDAPSIQNTVDNFRATFGGVDNGNVPGPLATGRREINWDDGGAAAPVLTNMPHDLFKNNRGAFFGPDTTIFSISGAPNAEFGNINATYPDTFTTFSAPRLFAPTNSITTELTFFVPGTNTAALVSGFGAVFTDVDLANTTKIQFFGINNTSLGTFFVPSANNGLSFLGISFDSAIVSRAIITTGSTILGPNDGGSIDVVAIDDFIYGEPQAGGGVAPVPEPSTFLLLASGLAGLGAWMWKNQGRTVTVA